MSDIEVPVAEFKRNFSRYVEKVLSGRSVRIVRHGKPVGDFVPAGTTLTTLPVAERPGGLLALAGLFGDWEHMEDDMREVVATRKRARDRPLPSLD
jgi:prevent-host-death family protein